MPTLSVTATPVSPSIRAPVTNGQLVATLAGTWSDGSPYTGTFAFTGPNFNHGGDYRIVGNQLQVANAANLNALGLITVEQVTIVAINQVITFDEVGF